MVATLLLHRCYIAGTSSLHRRYIVTALSLHRHSVVTEALTALLIEPLNGPVRADDPGKIDYTALAQI